MPSRFSFNIDLTSSVNAPIECEGVLFMKQGSLFCFVLFVKLRSLEPWRFNVALLTSWESSLMRKGGALTWFENVWSYGVKAINY
jgi:hypothetical protein